MCSCPTPPTTSQSPLPGFPSSSAFSLPTQSYISVAGECGAGGVGGAGWCEPHLLLCSPCRGCCSGRGKPLTPPFVLASCPGLSWKASGCATRGRRLKKMSCGRGGGASCRRSAGSSSPSSWPCSFLTLAKSSLSLGAWLPASSLFSQVVFPGCV